ncbi:hypothetical protein QBC34DRAFT_83022 [Podospora aff. communis PSN243]|uniref:C2H2-type domain-containing protein n=1 Tax=Podospora aff. communis PSN243 TaxID=3040156 RepID=A0AAV9GP41_9PEZI|nr:hypothetical protein QBC34DRAFT_83022 [Podospora aff. communis PSN243]
MHRTDALLYTDWEPPIELEEYFAEIKQRLDMLRERVKLETQTLIPGHEDTQVKVWSSMTDIFIFFLEQTMSTCQQRVRGNADISYFGPENPWTKPQPAADNTPHELLGFGDWSNVSHDISSGREHTVHRDVCPPSSLLYAVRSGEQELFCRVDCTTQQLSEILGVDLPTQPEADKERGTATPECSPMDTSGLSTSPTSPVSSEFESPIDHDAQSVASDDEDAMADEMISRVCDIVLRFCGGPASTSSTIPDLNAINQAVGTAVTDFVHELLNELSSLPPTRQCTGRGEGVSNSTFGLGSGSGGYGQSFEHAGIPSASGAQETSSDGQASQGAGGSGPGRPGRQGVSQSKDLPDAQRYSCPYRKRNPERFNSSDKRYKQCATTGWATFDKLKRHLREKHNPTPFECSRCKQSFPDEQARDEHNRSPSPCEFRDKAPTEGINLDDGMSAQVARRLNSRRPEDKIQSWDMLYIALFPAEKHVPLPYFEPPEEPIHVCSKIRKLLADKLPVLEAIIASMVPPDLSRQITNAVQAHQNQALTEFEASLKPQTGSKRASPQAGQPSAKRTRTYLSEDQLPSSMLNQPSVMPSVSHFPTMPQNQTVQRRAAGRGRANISRASDPQPPLLDYASAMFLPRQHPDPIPTAPSVDYPPVSESFSLASHTFGNMGSWEEVSMSNLDSYQLDDNSPYMTTGAGHSMPPDSTVTDGDTDSFADFNLGGPSHHT